MNNKTKPDWSKIGRSAKSKGHTGERRIASLLTEFTGVNFRKIPGSGGYNKTGGVVVAEHKFCGDIICDDPGFAFCVESKNRPDDFNFATLTTVPESADFTEWWYQVNAEAAYVKLLPILYFKLGKSTNNIVKNDYLAISPTIAEYLGLNKEVPHAHLHVYSDPVWVKIKVKVQGSKKKSMAKIKVRLPECWLISWIIFTRYAKKDRLFQLPDWVGDENKKFQILDRSGPDGVLWPKETETIQGV